MKFIQTDKRRLTDEQFNQVSKLKHFLTPSTTLSEDIINALKIIYPIFSLVLSSYDGDEYTIVEHNITNTYDPDRIYANCTLYNRIRDKFSQIEKWPEDYLISEEEWKFLIDQNIVELDRPTLDSYYTL